MQCANVLRGHLGLDGARYLILAYCWSGYKVILRRARSSLLELFSTIVFSGAWL